MWKAESDRECMMGVARRVFKGEAVMEPSQLLSSYRHGFREETYCLVNAWPIYGDEEGQIAGMMLMV